MVERRSHLSFYQPPPRSPAQQLWLGGLWVCQVSPQLKLGLTGTDLDLPSRDLMRMQT